MKQALTMFVVTLAAIALGLLAYDYYRRPDLDALLRQAAALHDQATALAQASRELASQVEQERTQLVLEKQRYLGASLLAEGLAASGNVKAAVAEFYLASGQWPSSNQDLGLPAPDQYRGRSLLRMEVGRDGVIVLTYDDKSGVDGGTVEIIPAASPALGVTWRCVTSSYPAIALAMPQCEYREPPAEPAGAPSS